MNGSQEAAGELDANFGHSTVHFSSHWNMLNMHENMAVCPFSQECTASDILLIDCIIKPIINFRRIGAVLEVIDKVAALFSPPVLQVIESLCCSGCCHDAFNLFNCIVIKFLSFYTFPPVLKQSHRVLVGYKTLDGIKGVSICLMGRD